jgi:hypothetical protein
MMNATLQSLRPKFVSNPEGNPPMSVRPSLESHCPLHCDRQATRLSTFDKDAAGIRHSLQVGAGLSALLLTVLHFTVR